MQKNINKEEVFLFIEGIYIKWTTYIGVYNFKKLLLMLPFFMCFVYFPLIQSTHIQI